MMPRRSRPMPEVSSSAFKGFRFPPEIIVLALRWYLRYGLSYRDVEELLGERGIEVDHVSAESISFAGASYRVGNAHKRRQVQLAIVGDVVEISADGEVIKGLVVGR
jgi:hypothetical protein